MDEPQKAGNTSPPPTFIVEPSSPHTHTIILLHGLSSNGQKFGSELLQSGVCSDGKTLPELLPGTRFVFPTSRWRRSSAFGRAKLTQWFNIASLEDPSFRSHTQPQGLEESYGEILEIVKREVEKVSRENVLLGGLSQGCAMGLICLLAIGFPIGGFVGMSGWLPFRNDMDDLLKVDDGDTVEDDPFGGEGEALDPAVKVLSYVRDLLASDDPEPPTRGNSALATPVFLGHGGADEKVRPSLGKQAHETMKAVGFEAEWKFYEGQGHWYKIPDEIDDIVEFIRTRVGWLV